uniref:Amiloride-sensitive sodium channel n=1 Tax=Brugia pahangi TaxID=6280 RepID=A0A0N4SZM3_BRUPA
LLKKPHCLRTLNEVKQLWATKLYLSTTTIATIKETTTTTTTTAPKQSARVTEPETVKAMGFTGMTDGVAMLTRAKENLIFTMSALSEVQRIALSQSKREFIEMCSFDGKECNIDTDFKLHVDPAFGNCYTFNWDVNNNHSSSKAGPMYGIRLLLFVNTSDYMATSEASGVRLAIHSPTDFPFPDTFGYSAPVGFASSFGLKKHVVQRLSAPYGDCQREKKMNSNVYIYGGYDYNPEGCHRSCFQNTLLNKCGCGDPRFPVPKGKIHCSAFNATTRGCLERTIAEIGDFHHIRDSLTDCQCKQSCEHEIYSVTFSASKWPSGASDLGNCDPKLNDEECRRFYRENAAMVEVYYEQLNYELLKESEAYGLVNLLADVGGHLGLWMGFSVITIIECAVLFIDLITLCCNKLKTKQDFKKTITIGKRQKKDEGIKDETKYREAIDEEIPEGNKKNDNCEKAVHV